MANSKFQGITGTPTYTFAEQPHMPGSNPKDTKNRYVPKLRHMRHGTIVAIYLPGTKKWQWTFNFQNVTAAQVDYMRQFFDLSAFHFYPDASGGTYYLVEVMDPPDVWVAELQGGTTYNVQFTIRQL